MKDDIIGMVRTAMLSGTFNRPAFEDALKNLEIVAAANERERIIAANAPEIERVNAHIKALEDAVKAERDAVCRIVTGLCISDNNAEEINRAIRARGQDPMPLFDDWGMK